MRVEFIGGPLDGEIMEMQGDPYEWRVPLMSGMNFLNHADPSTVPLKVNIREGIYRRSSLRRHRGQMHWMGE